jgi:hypothetical protein
MGLHAALVRCLAGTRVRCAAGRARRRLGVVLAAVLSTSFDAWTSRAGAQADPPPEQEPVRHELHVRVLHGLNENLPPSRTFTQDHASHVLQEAGEILQNDDDDSGPADVECGVGFELSQFSEFPSLPTDGVDPSAVDLAAWRNVESKRVARRIHRLTGSVKIVESIHVCGRVNLAIKACTNRRRRSVIVPTWPVETPLYDEAVPSPTRSREEDAGNLWLHEIGHVHRLNHRDHVTNDCPGVGTDDCEPGDHSSRPLMCKVVEWNEQVCQPECDRLRQ